MSKIKARIITKEYHIPAPFQAAIVAFLKGEISSRELGVEIGMSHQGVINLVTSVCRQWVREGKLTINEHGRSE